MVEQQRDVVSEIKEKCLIEDAVERDGYPLTKRGRYRKCTTAHTGGLVIDTRKQTYYWNAQSEWGDIIAWVERRHKVDFKGAVERLCQDHGMPLPNWGKQDAAVRMAARQRESALEVAHGVFMRWLWRSEEVQHYIEGRGWSFVQAQGDGDDHDKASTAMSAMLGYSGTGDRAEYDEMRQALTVGGVDVDSPTAVSIIGKRGGIVAWAKAHDVQIDNDEWVVNDYIPGMVGRKRLVYPHIRQGRVVYLSGRSIDAKFHYNLPVCLVGERQVYLNVAYTGEGECVVVEGQGDAVSLGQLGIAAVALAGVAPSEGLGEMLKRHKALYVGLDADEAGKKNAWRVADTLGPKVRLLRWENEGYPGWVDGSGETKPVKDANDLLRAMMGAGGSPAPTTGEMAEFVRILLADARTYVETVCVVAAAEVGAQRDDATRAALHVVARLDEMDFSSYRSRVAKWLEMSVRDLDHALKTLREMEKRSKTNGEVVYTMGGVFSGWLVEYTYDHEEKHCRLAWRDPDGRVAEGERVEIEGVTYVPEEASYSVMSGAVMMPSRLGTLKSTRELVVYVETYIRSAYLLPNATTAKIMAYYALLTWLYDAFTAIPYLRAMGEAGAGKSELMRRVGMVCYRLMSANGAGSASSLFRSVERYRGTVFVDEMDLQQSDTTNDIVKFLNLGAMKGNPIWRTEEAIGPDGKKTFVERTFETFCPKLIAMRKDFRDDAVGSRSLTFKVQPREPVELVEAGISLNITNEMRMRALALRNMLLRWRLEHWQTEIEIDPSFIDLEISSRLNQVTGALMAVAADDPELQGEMRQFLREYYAETVLSRSMTITARVIEALWKIYKFPDLRKEMIVTGALGDEKILIGAVTRISNELINEMNASGNKDDGDEEEGKDGKKHFSNKRDELSAQRVGRVIREELQLRVSERTKHGYYAFWDATRMAAVAKRYGISPDTVGPDKDGGKEPEKPVLVRLTQDKLPVVN